jgi:hypothetical protein
VYLKSVSGGKYRCVPKVGSWREIIVVYLKSVSGGRFSPRRNLTVPDLI